MMQRISFIIGDHLYFGKVEAFWAFLSFMFGFDTLYSS